MEIRLLDEVVDMEGLGILLFCPEPPVELEAGAQLRDALGRTHTILGVSSQEGITVLTLPAEDRNYFERLFRNVRVDATLFAWHAGE